LDILCQNTLLSEVNQEPTINRDVPNDLQLARTLSHETNGLRVEINFFYNI
jgi:hypothetical protein